MKKEKKRELIKLIGNAKFEPFLGGFDAFGGFYTDDSGKLYYPESVLISRLENGYVLIKDTSAKTIAVYNSGLESSVFLNIPGFFVSIYAESDKYSGNVYPYLKRIRTGISDPIKDRTTEDALNRYPILRRSFENLKKADEFIIANRKPEDGLIVIGPDGSLTLAIA